jgi:hypothetical protein
MEEAKSRSATHETEATRATIKAIAMLVVRIFRGQMDDLRGCFNAIVMERRLLLLYRLEECQRREGRR